MVRPLGIVGGLVSLVGWWWLNWVDDLGKLWEILSVSLMISGVVIFGVGIWKAFDRGPALVVDSEGLLDRTSIPARRIGWNEIKAFNLAIPSGRNPQILGIQLVDPGRFIQSARFGAGAVLTAFEKAYGTPCVIPLKSLDIEPHSLLARLRSAQSERKA